MEINDIFEVNGVQHMLGAAGGTILSSTLIGAEIGSVFGPEGATCGALAGIIVGIVFVGLQIFLQVKKEGLDSIVMVPFKF